MAKRPDIKAAEDHVRAHVFKDPDLEHAVVTVIGYMNALEGEMIWMGRHGGLSIEAVHLIEQTGSYKHNADFVKVPMADPGPPPEPLRKIPPRIEDDPKQRRGFWHWLP